MSIFPKVANIQVGDNVYDIKDNLDRAKYNVEKQRTLQADNTLILNKAALADVITEKGVTTDASDTLMQMARWFGYRKGYELLQRIWLSDESKKHFELLQQITNRITNEVKGVNRVVFDLTPKPSGTIEWE